ncbi:MAG: UDP-N-acetylglucosamine pyrophosphorylase [Candidatus Aminicenantes bacterium]|nr:UDP-N-acetylglucosamine pyrophosphorylase [Candidatus Aminicenantes bacterium]
MALRLADRLRSLEKRGITIIDTRQTYLDEHVDINRICAGSILYPGTRLIGARTFIGPGAKVGSEGPATVDNGILGENAEIAGGFLKEAVLMRGARVGANAHVRAGSLLEEEASTAHAVGLKHTILLSYVTFGSIINFCDGLIAGGASRKGHSEVGSGFIHFNYSPWGQYGDKATPSLIGDVPRGVFLREARIFLGGAGGVVGPQKVGFGSITAAGQVIRDEVPENRLVCKPAPEIDKESSRHRTDPPEKRTELNLEYIGQLLALKAWYEEVRLSRIPGSEEFDHLRIVTEEAIKTLQTCIQERINRLLSFLAERVADRPVIKFDVKPCPLTIKCEQPYVDHVDWVRGVPEDFLREGVSWLKSIAESVNIS